MADLSGARDRAQLVLVTGLVVAVALVVLVLLVNTAIYTQNLATRDAEIGETDALEYREAVRDGTGAVIDAENEAEHGDYGAVEANASEAVNRTVELLARGHAEGGSAADIEESATAYHEGRLARQTDESRNFTNTSGTADWTLATAVPEARAVDARMGQTELVNISLVGVGVGDAFHLVVNDTDSSDEWHAYVYEDTGDLVVATKNASEGSPSEVCRTSRSVATVEFTRGRLAGEPCRGLDWGKGVTGEYDLEYRNGNEINGTYNATLNVTAVETASLNTGAGSASPYAVPAVYSAAFDVSFETTAVGYADRVRVAPGESDG